MTRLRDLDLDLLDALADQAVQAVISTDDLRTLVDAARAVAAAQEILSEWQEQRRILRERDRWTDAQLDATESDMHGDICAGLEAL